MRCQPSLEKLCSITAQTFAETSQEAVVYHRRFASVLAMAALAAILLPSFLHAQITFQRTYGGAGDDLGLSVQQTSDGGYIVAGRTCSFGAGNGDFYLIKTTAAGDTLWTRTYGGLSIEAGYSVEQTSDSGYIIAGYTWSFGAGNTDFYLVKTNASGDTLWTRTYGETSMDEAYCVRRTTDGGYIVVGSTDNFGVTYDHVLAVKTNASGDTIWTRIYGGENASAGYSVQPTRDGGYVIAGDNTAAGAGVYLVKTNAQGDTLWTRTYGGTYGDAGHSVQQTTDDGYVIAGVDDSAGVREHAYLIRTNPQGETLWTRTYGGLSSLGMSVQLTADGGYIVAGSNWRDSSNYGGVYLVKTNALGDTLWTRTHDASFGVGFCVQPTADGGYIVAGCGGNPEIRDVCLIKTDSLGNVAVAEPKTSLARATTFSLTCEPNPCRGQTEISLKPQAASSKPLTLRVYDSQGSIVLSREVSTSPFPLSTPDLPSGAYFVHLDAGDEHTTARLVVQR